MGGWSGTAGYIVHSCRQVLVDPKLWMVHRCIRLSSCIDVCFGIEELTKIAPEDAIALFRRMINKIQEHTDEAPGEHHWLNSAEAVIPLLAAQPEDLVAMTTELKNLCMKGIYSGEGYHGGPPRDPASIFTNLSLSTISAGEPLLRSSQA